MKKILFGLSIFAGIYSKAESVIQKDIQVKEVTVYLRGAKVYGNTLVGLQKGKNFIKLVNLPNDLDDNTYKINLDKSTTLLSITPQVNHLNNTILSNEELKLEANRQRISREADLINIQINNLTGEQNVINSNLQVVANDKTSPQEQLVKLTEFYRKRMLEIETQKYFFNEKKALFLDSVANIQKQLAASQTHLNKNKKELMLEILAERDINLDLGVSYIVSNAGWTPNYDLRASSIKSPLEIIYKGRIFQRTGQDWKNVKLYVSTYKPSYNQNRPILNPMYVSEYSPVIVTGYASAAYEKKKELAFANAYQVREEKNEQEVLPVTSVNDNQMNVLYELNYQQSIYSQEKEQYVLLDKKEVTAEYKYHTVPKVSNQAYLLAFISNWQNLNLVSGEANIFFEDNYVGKTRIESNYLKDKFPVSLGVDERIVVKRIKVEDKANSRFLNASKWENEAYTINIRNNTKEAIDIEVLDQVPISENSKISVKALSIDNGEYDEKTGSILWNKKIASGATEKINLSYEVKYPKDMQVQYYNR
ncbi:DUF4139 domain-containing protein [Polluticaenibacter yanchengensis]|uniref:DUF4139 domain-containing protein n=1 Tax=Polluticaenibacter yanchengensis TaxID=3014562 RepID=A0ABT4UI71_9BACT|nr:DUF4139 domain-containing protein [Chitinophagaceae bacterium LY-5]